MIVVWPFSEKAGSFREEKVVDFPEVFDALEEGFAIIDREHNIIIANKTLADMVGMPRYSVEGSKCYQVIHNTNTPVLSCPHIKSLERKRISSMTAKEPKLGSGTYQFTASPVIGSEGNLRYFVYTIRNVSELENIRSDLVENRKRWQLLFDKGTDAMFVIGLKEDGRPGKFLEVNEVACQKLGYEREEILGLSPFEVFDPERMMYTQGLIRKLIPEKSASFESVLVKKNRNKFPVKVYINLFESDGKRNFLIITRDISEIERAEEEIKKYSKELEQSNKLKDIFANILDYTTRDAVDLKKAKEALEESEKRYRLLFNKSNDSMFVIGLKEDGRPGKFLEVNEVACQKLDYTREEIIDLSPFEILDPEMMSDPDVLENLFLEKNAIFETVIRKKDGRSMPVELNANLFDLNGERIILSIARDITERKKAEERLKRYSEELEQSNKLKDVFIDVLRHDLLNPAVYIKNMAGLALEDEQDQNKKEVLQSFYRNSGKIIDIAENASILAKIESQNQLKFKEVDLGDVLKGVLDEISYLAEEKYISIKTPNKQKYPAEANSLIHVVFSNLLSNAIKFGPPYSDVVVSIVENGIKWRISVADTGEGIPDVHKEAIFERFKRFEKGPIKGTGLGLAIVKKVAEVHNGRAWVEDNPPGGSIFYFEIPKIRASGSKERF